MLNPGGQVIDMSFERVGRSTSSSLSVGWLIKALALIVVVGILYVGGGLIFQGAENIKDNITDIAARGLQKLEAAAAAIVEQDVGSARANFVAAENLFASAQKDILSLGQTNLYLSGLASGESRVVTGQKLVDSGINLARAGQIFVDALAPLIQYVDGMSQGQIGIEEFAIGVSSILAGSATDVERALARVAKANELLTSVPLSLLDPIYRSAVADAQTKTAALQNLVVAAGTLAVELPDVLGMNNPRHYMILNQNDSELRPTGGFLGSITLVELYQGKIVDVLVDDAYRVDGQIVGPYASEKVFPNANFEPDFVASASKLESLYEEGGGGSVDGIIAVNTHVMSKVLTALGDIYLPDRGIVVTPANFAQIIHGEIDREAGSSAPKQVLNELLPKILDKFTALNKDQITQLGAILLEELKEKNLLVKSNNRDLQPWLEKMNWAGRLYDAGDKQDFLIVARANMGARKSSHSIVEEIDHVANVNLSGETSIDLTLAYAHVGTNSYPDGVNQEFIRVYVPQGSVLQTISGIDEETQVVSETGYDKTVFAFWVTTEPGETRRVVLSYQLPFSLAPGQEPYTVYFQKQPGANSTILTSVIRLSPALELAESGDLKTKKLFTGKLVQDVELGVDFIPVN